jgi:hypothetical protein
VYPAWQTGLKCVPKIFWSELSISGPPAAPFLKHGLLNNEYSSSSTDLLIHGFPKIMPLPAERHDLIPDSSIAKTGEYSHDSYI